MGIEVKSLNIIDFIYGIIGGLGIFLYGLRLMSNSLKYLAGQKIIHLIKKTTGSPIKGLITGTIVTAIIQSSSATTSITLGLVTSGLMTFSQAFYVIIGANVGTTATSVIIGLNISDHALVIIAIGAFLALFFQKEKISLVGSSILGLGMLFFGLDLVSSELIRISTFPFFQTTLQNLTNNRLLATLIGAVLTAMVFSSSAVIGITQKLYAAGALEISAALPIVLGANIGTTVTAIIALVGATIEAKRTAVANILFNIIGAIVFLVFLQPIIKLMILVENTFFIDHSMGTISFFHIIFNVVSTIFMLFFVDALIRFVSKLIPEKGTPEGQLISDFH